jgi:hypothetical protein
VMLPPVLQRVRTWWGDEDLRRFTVRHLLRPWGVQPQRPDLRARTPPYISVGIRSERLAWPEVPPLVRWGSSMQEDGPCELMLASRTLAIASLTSIPWTAAFDDPEDTAALHRFAWLAPWLLERAAADADADATAALVEAAIRGWMTHRANETPGTAAAQPYTVAERLVNWTWASLSLGRRIHAADDVRSSMVRQLAYLGDHLEYYGDALTGNHLSNDGRGLYIGGIAAEHPEASALGRTILLEERVRLFEEPWFAREGSSHYQFLIARNYVEALWFAERSGDRELACTLRPTVARLIEGCRFFLVRRQDGRWLMPLFGDLSPDCSPEWLIERSVLAQSWWTESASPVASREWARSDVGAWTLFAHANPSGTPRHHAHQDTGGVVAYYGGTAVLIDTGRVSYRDTVDGRWGRQWRAHSICAVDGLNPAPFWHWAYSDADLRRLTGPLPALSTDSDGIVITHGGFGRRGGVGTYGRVARVSGDRLTLSDSVEGKGRHRVDIVLHIPAPACDTGPALLFDFGSFRLRVTGPRDLCERTVHRGAESGDGFGWAAVRYGASTAVTSVVFSGDVALPWSGATTFEIDSRPCAA